MSEPFLGEVKIVPWTFAAKGWAFCNGQLLPIAQNQALFSLLGITYGGDGRTNFNLPNLAGRTPIHWSNKSGPVTAGQAGGEVAHTLVVNEMPSHSHTPSGSTTSPNQAAPGGGVLAGRAGTYTQSTSNLTPLIAGTIGKNSGDQPHPNMQPYLVLNFLIALVGAYPSRN